MQLWHPWLVLLLLCQPLFLLVVLCPVLVLMVVEELSYRFRLLGLRVEEVRCKVGAARGNRLKAIPWPVVTPA